MRKYVVRVEDFVMSRQPQGQVEDYTLFAEDVLDALAISKLRHRWPVTERDGSRLVGFRQLKDVVAVSVYTMCPDCHSVDPHVRFYGESRVLCVHSFHPSIAVSGGFNDGL